MQTRKISSIYFLFFLVLSISLVSATDWGYGSGDGITIITNANLSTANVNNSLYWQGHTGTDGSWLTGISNWIKTTNIAGSVTLHPDNLSQNVGVGTNNSAYDLEVRNLDGDNTALGISSGTGNSNASLFFREADAVRYRIFYDGRTSLFNLYSFAIDKIVLSFDTTGKAEFSQNVNVVGNLTAPNICLSNGTGCSLGNPFNQVLNKTSDVTFENITVTGHSAINSSKGQMVHLDNFVVHTQEMMTDTLLDKSIGTLSCVGGELNYTLYAFHGQGQFNFGGVLYPSDHTVDNATITLTCGTDITPVINYIYWELVGGVPTMKTAAVYPAGEHIDVATFIVGACSGTSYTIYSYSRNRYEVDSFIKRVIHRFENSGTLYVSGFIPAANTTQLNVTSGGEFMNGIFEMTSTNAIKLTDGFNWINSTANFKSATDLSGFTQYNNGVAFSGGPNERVNVIWGLVPINTTGGTGPTQMRLYAVVANEPTVKYNTVAEAIADIYNTAVYYPPNAEVKNVFVPIARTILRPSTDTFEVFSSGLYFQDLRGMVTSGGGAGTTVDTSVFLLKTGTTPLTGNWNVGNFSITNVSNVNATNGFFSNLGSALSRITKGWFTNLDVSGGNIEMNTGNITNVTYIKLNEVSGACDLTRNHTICSNLSGTFFIG